MNPPSNHDDDYVAFTRRMLEDLASGQSFPADHYAKLFPGAADAIRADLAADDAESDSGAADQGPPALIGTYEVTGEMPSGGMGRLFLARHPETGRKLVIKTAKPGLVASARALDRLKREAAILRRLDHDRICPVTDVVIEGEGVFVVMPFIEGDTLEARLGRAASIARKGGKPQAAWDTLGGLPAALSLLEEISRAIHTAHEKGVVHRDLKPGNILVLPDGHPMVLDFGLAVDLTESKVRRLTMRGDLIGTPSYMAPEQVRSELEAIDRRTDVYALGVILYELLTFRRAFKGVDLKAIQTLVVSGRIDPPVALNSEVPRDLQAVCLKAMELRPRNRYTTALDLAEDLRRARSRERTVARPTSKVRRLFQRLLGA